MERDATAMNGQRTDYLFRSSRAQRFLSVQRGKIGLLLLLSRRTSSRFLAISGDSAETEGGGPRWDGCAAQGETRQDRGAMERIKLAPVNYAIPSIDYLPGAGSSELAGRHER